MDYKSSIGSGDRPRTSRNKDTPAVVQTAGVPSNENRLTIIYLGASAGGGSGGGASAGGGSGGGASAGAAAGGASAGAGAFSPQPNSNVTVARIASAFSDFIFWLLCRHFK